MCVCVSVCVCYGRREGALWETYGNPKRILWEEKGKATEARCYGTGAADCTETDV